MEVVLDLPADGSAEGSARLRQRVAHLEEEIARVRHDAYHDPLTGLPNRALLLDRLGQAILQTSRQYKTVGLLLIDLDGFNGINDTLGHGAGDLLLQQIAARLLQCLRGSDTACRYGGDEFVVMLPEIDVALHAQQMRTVVRKIRGALSAPYLLEGRPVTVCASIGAAVLKDGDPQGTELIRTADAAMYHDKSRGTGGTSQEPIRPDRPAGPEPIASARG